MAIAASRVAEDSQLLVADRGVETAGHEPPVFHLRAADSPLPEL